jgi:hypothetical protein
MRDKNAGADKSHQYGKLNHGTHPYAQPALMTSVIDRHRSVSE